jgi:phage baseplate assembly protein W
MGFILKKFDEDWCYDLHQNFISNGEILNELVIKQSIDSIILTNFGERLFNRSFGSGLLSYVFENINEKTGEQILDNLINSIKKWEDRIIVDSNNCKLNVNVDENSISVIIPYKIIRTGNNDVYVKNITF